MRRKVYTNAGMGGKKECWDGIEGRWEGGGKRRRSVEVYTSAGIGWDRRKEC